MHWFGILFGLLIAILDLMFFLNGEDKDLFFFLFGITLGIVALPFVIGIILENKRGDQISEMFLEFSRNLAESVTTGTPISKSIINMRSKNYGSLTPYVRKLANQISLGIPVDRALQTFSEDVDNPVISRAIALIREAEKAGGEIDYILDSVAKSISEVEKLKRERKAAIYSIVVQGYIIFFIFIGIMLVMEFKILPLTSGLGGFGSFSDIGSIQDISKNKATAAFNPEELTQNFLYLLVAQGIFAGITIGKLTEGSLKAGIKHSFVLAIAAILISSGARVFLGH